MCESPTTEEDADFEAGYCTFYVLGFGMLLPVKTNPWPHRSLSREGLAQKSHLGRVGMVLVYGQKERSTKSHELNTKLVTTEVEFFEATLPGKARNLDLDFATGSLRLLDYRPWEAARRRGDSIKPRIT